LPERFESVVNRSLFLVIIGLLILASNTANVQVGPSSEVGPFEMAEWVVRPSEMVQSEFTINPTSGDKGSFIPVTILHGNQEGPVLPLIAGIHGSEYSPILLMQELPALLDSTKMSGTLVIVHIANQIFERMNSLAQ
jgi:predicted deacylase